MMMAMMAAMPAHEGESHAPAHEGMMIVTGTAEHERENEEDTKQPQHDDSSFRFFS